MIVSVIFSAIACGLAGLAVSAWQGLGLGAALLFYVLSGVLGVASFIAVRVNRRHAK